MPRGTKGTSTGGEDLGSRGWSGVGVCPLYIVNLCEDAQAQGMSIMNTK